VDTWIVGKPIIKTFVPDHNFFSFWLYIYIYIARKFFGKLFELRKIATKYLINLLMKYSWHIGPKIIKKYTYCKIPNQIAIAAYIWTTQFGILSTQHEFDIVGGLVLDDSSVHIQNLPPLKKFILY
jgi:hypothetical protein